MPPVVVGFKRSRALWDQASRTPHESRWLAVQSYARAILYELQPFRLAPHLQRADWQRRCHVAWRTLQQWVCRDAPALSRRFLALLRTVTARQWCYVGGVLLYYWLVQWIHRTLEAGPAVLIVTALIGIFTVGLSDEEENRNGLSAYAVFNRGFQRLLGSVNEQELLAQHVGGGLAGAAFPVGAAPPNANDFDDEDADDHLIRPRGRRQQPAAAAAPNQEDDNDDDDSSSEDEGGDRQQARRSGKRNRRRNLEQRREMRRQREAAAAMGFGNGNAAGAQGGGGDEDLAMQQLLEQQIQEAAAAAAARRDDNVD